MAASRTQAGPDAARPRLRLHTQPATVCMLACCCPPARPGSPGSHRQQDAKICAASCKRLSWRHSAAAPRWPPPPRLANPKAGCTPVLPVVAPTTHIQAARPPLPPVAPPPARPHSPLPHAGRHCVSPRAGLGIGVASGAAGGHAGSLLAGDQSPGVKPQLGGASRAASGRTAIHPVAWRRPRRAESTPPLGCRTLLTRCSPSPRCTQPPAHHHRRQDVGPQLPAGRPAPPGALHCRAAAAARPALCEPAFLVIRGLRRATGSLVWGCPGWLGTLPGGRRTRAEACGPAVQGVAAAARAAAAHAAAACPLEQAGQ